jgi:hypothetical protein
VIQIDPDVFTFQPELDMSNERFVVTGVQDAGPVVAALERASERFMGVDTNGVEHATYESLISAADAGADSPSYVSDPEVTERGVEVYIDCKGVIEDAMGATLRKILTEELAAAGYAGRVSAVVHAQ